MDAKTLLGQNQPDEPTPEEQAIKDYYDIYVNITPQDLLAMEPDLNELRLRTIGPHINHVRTAKTIWCGRMAVAAAIFIILSLVGTLFMTPDHNPPVNFANVVNPGTDKAILTLANGTKINLSVAKSGTLLKREGIEITKTEDGTLVYKISASKSNASRYNTITTPRGGQYKIILSDGTKVWLNAASSLSYPASLNDGGKARRVKMSGEAYFEVKEDKAHPFIVTTDQQELEVLGTHFNVSAYPDERSVKTTLLEGSVRISARSSQDGAGTGPDRSGVILKPNQQSTLTQNNIQIAEVNTEEAVAWKNGEFIFQNKPLEIIMLEISRWYNVDIVYKDKQVAQKLFGGVISRSEDISLVLSVLEVTGDVHFKVEGRTVTVMK